MKKVEIIGLAVAFAAIIGLFYCLFAYVNTQELFQSLARTFSYPGIFLLSFIGAASVIFPIPYTVVLLTISAPQFGFDPLLLAIAAGLGAAVGELVSYGLGYVGRGAMSKKHKRRLNAVSRIFDRFGLPAIFIFALTPLPDDLLFIPLGLMRYSLWRAFIACAAGKFFMCLIIAYVGEAAGQLFAEGWLLAAVTAILLVLIVIAMFRIDWEKLAEKYAPRKARKRSRS